MKIIEILPELNIGGVERHVIDLSNELAERGHDVLVISNGGQMQGQLYDKVLHWQLPVHKKDPFTAFSCSKKIFSRVKDEGWEVIHAHSRVPAWIAWIVSYKTKVPWLYTAHACYSLNYGLIPLKHAKYVISVSETVQDHIKSCLPENYTVIPVALPEPTVRWDSRNRSKNRLIFVGRLTKIKGLDTVIEALGKLQNDNWTLDVIGDGPEREELEKRSYILGLNDKITFHGYCENPDSFIAMSSCLLFPSRNEGYGLVPARAAQIGLPVIASNIPAVFKMAGSKKGLVEPGDVEGWYSAIFDFLSAGRAVEMPLLNIDSFERMVDSNESVYSDLLCD